MFGTRTLGLRLALLGCLGCAAEEGYVLSATISAPGSVDFELLVNGAPLEMQAAPDGTPLWCFQMAYESYEKANVVVAIATRRAGCALSEAAIDPRVCKPNACSPAFFGDWEVAEAKWSVGTDGRWMGAPVWYRCEGPDGVIEYDE